MKEAGAPVAENVAALPGRNGKAVQDRWRVHLKPTQQGGPGPIRWSSSERVKLHALRKDPAVRMKDILNYFAERSFSSVVFKYKMLLIAGPSEWRTLERSTPAEDEKLVQLRGQRVSWCARALGPLPPVLEGSYSMLKWLQRQSPWAVTWYVRYQCAAASTTKKGLAGTITLSRTRRK